jgi:hypothetical protein
MAPAEFDRIWFLRMRSLPRLSLTDCDDEDEDDIGGDFSSAGERDRLLPPLPVTFTASLGRSLRPATTSPPSPPPASQRKSLAAAPAATGASAESEPMQGSVEIGGGNVSEAQQKKSRWRNKAGVLCTIL